MTRMIVCGGRDFNDRALLHETLAEAIMRYLDVEIVSGHARGADIMGEWYAKDHGIPCKVFPAQWDKYGKSAGYRRNAQMLEYAMQERAVVIAFWDGQSRGTKHMIETSKKAGAEVIVIGYRNEKEEP